MQPPRAVHAFDPVQLDVTGRRWPAGIVHGRPAGTTTRAPSPSASPIRLPTEAMFGRTRLARTWRGHLQADALTRTQAEHLAI